ncbi:MAG: 6-phosphogluconolactonase [Acidobacteria bacterium]|nr:6-phosphogluconolactonase [Acidobacteriota bacterium]
MHVRRFDGSSALVAAAVRHVRACAECAVRARGEFLLVLSGGSTPKPVYEALSRVRGFPWAATHVFFGDERVVPPADAASNFRMVNEALLAHVPIDPARIHRMAGEADPMSAASAYDALLRATLGAGAAFDLTLLGMGDDGHIASIFPGSPLIHGEGAASGFGGQRALAPGHDHAFAAAVRAPSGQPRITLTPAALRQSRVTSVLVSGAGKASMLREVLTGPVDPTQRPAQLLRQWPGRVTWFVDRDAAVRLP